MDFLLTFVIWTGIFTVAMIWLLQREPIKKYGLPGAVVTCMIASFCMGLLLAMFHAFPGYSELGGGLVGGVSNFLALMWVNRCNVEKRQEKLNWFLETDNEEVKAFRDEVVDRAFDQSYGSMAQKQDDIKRLGALLNDHDLAATYLAELEKRGVCLKEALASLEKEETPAV